MPAGFVVYVLAMRNGNRRVGRAKRKAQSRLISTKAVLGLGAALALPVAGVVLAAGAESRVEASVVEFEMPSQPVAVDDTESTASRETQPQMAASESAETEQGFRELALGEASYYGPGLEGNRTASGERFDPQALTAAHRTLPFGSKVKVTDRRSGKSVIVRINDRGPFHGGRIIDLSEAAARQIGLVARGSGTVRLSLLTD